MNSLFSVSEYWGTGASPPGGTGGGSGWSFIRHLRPRRGPGYAGRPICRPRGLRQHTAQRMGTNSRPPSSHIVPPTPVGNRIGRVCRYTSVSVSAWTTTNLGRSLPAAVRQIATRRIAADQLETRSRARPRSSQSVTPCEFFPRRAGSHTATYSAPPASASWVSRRRTPRPGRRVERLPAADLGAGVRVECAHGGPAARALSRRDDLRQAVAVRVATATTPPGECGSGRRPLADQPPSPSNARTCGPPPGPAPVTMSARPSPVRSPAATVHPAAEGGP